MIVIIQTWSGIVWVDAGMKDLGFGGFGSFLCVSPSPSSVMIDTVVIDKNIYFFEP